MLLVPVIRGGVAAGLAPAAAVNLINREKAMVVDVCSAQEFAAGVLGYWASGYTLRPLGRVSDAAEAVALGQLDTRIDEREYARDRDLAPLVSNFNAMVDALEDRIDRDALAGIARHYRAACREAGRI
jgi:methyl-accepting chemotaxis protein